MFKKRSAPKTLRKREDGEGGSSDDDTKVMRSSLVPSTSSSSFAAAAAADEASLVTTVYESKRELLPAKYAGDATHTSEIDTSTDRDSRAIGERNARLQQGGEGEAVYKGQGAYKSYVAKDAAKAVANKSGTLGPVRAPAFLRATVRFDYKPDICKDYKETGYCGFGDSCIFLHDRGDYKSGWQLEKEWDTEQAKKKKRIEESVKAMADGEDRPSADDDEENYEIDLDAPDAALPFACHLCREPFTNPVGTACGHYFCSACILEHSKASPKCPVCGKETYGVYNKADKLLRCGGRAVVLCRAASKGRWEDVSRE